MFLKRNFMETRIIYLHYLSSVLPEISTLFETNKLLKYNNICEDVSRKIYNCLFRKTSKNPIEWGSVFYKNFKLIVRYPRRTRMMFNRNEFAKRPHISPKVHFVSLNYRCFYMFRIWRLAIQILILMYFLKIQVSIWFI